MAAKKTPTYSDTPDWIESGDSEFDTWWESVWKTVEESGNAEGLDPIEARALFARRITEFGTKDLSHVFAEATTKKRPAKAKATAQEEEPEVAAPPLVLRIPTFGSDPHWYEDEAKGRLIEHFITMRRAVGKALPGGLVLTGPAGSGKTMGLVRRLTRMGLAFMIMDCATATDPQKWFGRREIDKDGSRYETSDLIRAIETGQVIILDELNRLHAFILNGIMPFLTGTQAIHLSDLNYTVHVHPETVFLATMNQGVQYGGTHRMDFAHRERFPFTVEIDFPEDENEEAKVLTTYVDIDPDAAHNLVRVAKDTRRKQQAGDLRMSISTRTLANAAVLVASGYDERTALEFTALPMFDGNADGQIGEKSERAIAQGIIEGGLKK